MNATNETCLCQWTANGLVYKLYVIPREKIDAGSDDPTTYWQAETYRHGQLKSIDFPRRATAEEALADDQSILKSDEIGAAVEWVAIDGKSINTGRVIVA